MPIQGTPQFENLTGEVQDTPTVNTVLRRLKDLLTGITLDTNTKVIGRVGHDKTSIGDGRKTVAAAGTRETLVAASTLAKIVIITGETDNTGIVVVGSSTVIAALATRRGTPLMAGDTVTLEVDDLLDISLDVTVSGDGVTYTYLV